MPSTSKVDKTQPKKLNGGGETSVTQEKKGKKRKTPTDEVQRAEEEELSSRKMENMSSEKKGKRKRATEGEGTTLVLGSLAQELEERSKPAKRSQKPKETIIEPSQTASRPVKRNPAAETSKNTSDPSRPSEPVGAHEVHVPKQKKRPHGDDESTVLTNKIPKKLKLNDGGAAEASWKTQKSLTKGGKNSSKGEEEVMPEDSSDEEVEEGHIHGFSTDEDTSDDDIMVPEVPALDVSQLPAIAKDDATIQRRLQKAKSKPVSILNSDYYVVYPRPYRQWTVVYFISVGSPTDFMKNK